MISFKNIYENNLKNISIDIPLNKITTITGISGSGKSSLIYNVIAKEAQRREKIDSGKANFVDFAVRPKFESVKNLPYCVSLKQRGLNKSISSTLATITSLHEILREEFVKQGIIITPQNNIVKKPTSSDISNFILKYYPKKECKYFAIVCYREKTDGYSYLSLLKKYNISNAVFISSFDEKENLKKVSSIKQLNSKYKHTILVPISNIKELYKFEDLALKSFLVKIDNTTLNFLIDYPDLISGKIYQRPSTNLLSFNSISRFSGKCLNCEGKGNSIELDISNLILKDKKLNDYFLNFDDNGKGCYKYLAICKDSLIRTLKKEKIDIEKTFFELNQNEQEFILNIVKTQVIKHQNKPSIGKYLINSICKECSGTRLNYKANAIKLFGKNISEILTFTVDDLLEFFKDKKIENSKILNILQSLKNATLGYLSLNRTTDTLSGGELQRVKIAIELNNYYKNLLYILDEPSCGLHPYNNHQIMQLIKNLKEKNNTIIISEHNNLYLKNSDYQIELGYGSGFDGGNIIFQGYKDEYSNNEIVYRKKIPFSIQNSIELIGVNINNVVNQNFTIPLNCLVLISGVSGCGKSSLIHKALVPLGKQYLADKTINYNLVKNIKNFDLIKDIIEITQSQIGVNSRSVVATYLDIFDDIREIYASTHIAKKFNFNKGYFSFNIEIGACETCSGLGEIEDEICPFCLGRRYKPEILNILFQKLNIYELLSLPIKEIDNLFDNPKLKFAFDLLSKLGLSHLSLLRTTPTLSGGEAQRLKLAKVLIDSYLKIQKGGYLFILDEPTTGLNDKDIVNLYKIFDEILSYKNSIIVIEHNQNMIRNSDYIIDIGAGSGKDGGKNIFSGTFEDLVLNKNSITAKALNGKFENINQIQYLNTELIDKKYDFNIENYSFNKLYLNDEHFRLEEDFSNSYSVICDNKNNKYFKTKNELFEYIANLESISFSFNPYTTELYKYQKVPISIKKEKLKHLKSLGFKIGTNDYLIDEWKYRINCNNIEEAFNFGNGWISISSNGEIIELFTRFISLKNKIIGTSKISSKTFNLYYNGCKYCLSNGNLVSYNLDLIIKNSSKSILDSDFLNFNTKLNLKSIIQKFKDENLFDFSKPFIELSKEEKDMFLYGFKEYQFLKKNGRVNAIGDYLKWEGLYTYLKKDLEIHTEDLKYLDCPFCIQGFNKEINFYTYNNKKIFELL